MNLEPLKVLVVDDSATMRRIVRNCLDAFFPCDVDEAEDGVIALEKVSQKRYDVVFLDWNMPNKNGYDTLVEVKKMSVETKVIMVSTESERVNIVRAVKAGADNYVVKPFTSDTLVDKLKKVLGVDE